MRIINLILDFYSRHEKPTSSGWLECIDEFAGEWRGCE